MKKLLAMLVLLTAALCLFACNNNEGDNGDTVDVDTDNASVIALISPEATAYTLVRPDSADEDTMKAVQNLRKALSEATGLDIPIATDWENKDVTEEEIAGRHEILIGKTNRKESAHALEAITDANGYIVSPDGNKLVINALDTKALPDAVEAFLATVLQTDTDGKYKAVTEVTVMSNLKLTGTRDLSKSITILIPDSGAVYADALVEKLGSITTKLKIAHWDDDAATVFDTGTTDLVIVCGAETAPYGTLTAASEYMKDGGRLLTLGGPPFANTLYKTDGVWQTHQQYINSLSESAETNVLIDTTNVKILKRFTRSCDDIKSKKTVSLEAGARDGSETPSIKVEIEKLTSWDLFNYSVKIPEGDNAFAFWAKGTDLATSLYVEVSESDGSRWYAVPELTTDWQYNILTSSDFVYWEGNGRGGAGDKLDVSKVRTIGFGFAMSGQPSIPVASHTFWLDNVCTAYYQPGGAETEVIPVIDGIAPQYKFYQITNAASVTAHTNQIFVADTEYKLDGDMYSVAPARQGTGFDNGRQNRFIPLLEVKDEKGLRSGFAAWMYIFESEGNLPNPCPGAILASFGAGEGNFYDEAGLKAVTDTVTAMLRENFLIEGGTDEYIYIESETDTLKLGAIASSSAPSGAEVKVTLYNKEKVLHEFSALLADANPLNTIGGDSIYRFEDSYKLEEKPDRAVTELSVGGVLCDRIVQDVSFWAPSSEHGFLYTENGSFMRDGEMINLYGVNYMPSSGMANETGELFEYYVSSASYDPDVFYNDLLHVKDLGFNAVSIFVYANTVRETNNMLHLVEMCNELGLLVDLSIRPTAYPFKYNESDVEALITKLHFNENTNIVAYDIAWEATIGTYEGGSFTAGGSVRQDLDDNWREWIDVQYGSIEQAEAAWGISAPRINGVVVGATDEMISSGENSKCKALVAAYRRFIDDMVASRFTYVSDHIRSLAPDQLISFRMQTAGSADSDPAQYHYDYQSLASSLDFMSPEAYALSSTKGNTRQGVFANLYARYVKPNSPTVWKEFGYSVWSGSNIDQSVSKLEYQAEFYRDIYEMCLEGYTAATYCWYYTPGFRCFENSDYGVLNPDGSDRPVTAVIREYADKFKNIGELKEPDYFINIDRDAHPDGIRGMYYGIKEELEAALDDGHTVALINEAIGKKLSEVINIAVGNASADNESYPRKYVNGTITGVYAESGDGVNTAVSDNGSYTADGIYKLKLNVTNTAYASWADKEVSLVLSGAGDAVIEIPAAEYLDRSDLSFEMPDKNGEYILRLKAGDVLFGNDFCFTVK